MTSCQNERGLGCLVFVNNGLQARRINTTRLRCGGDRLFDVEGSDALHLSRRRKGQKLLARGVASIVSKKEERAVASLFTPGGTHAMKGEFQGINDFEVVAFLAVLPDTSSGADPA